MSITLPISPRPIPAVDAGRTAVPAPAGGESAPFAMALRALAAVSLLAGLADIRSTFPVFLLLLPAYALSALLPSERWERPAFVPLLALALADAMTYGLALYDAYSPSAGFALAAGLNLGAGLFLWKGDPGAPRSETDPARPGRGNGTAIVALAAVLGLHYFYGMAFPFPRFDNGPYCAYAQTGLEIVRRGTFHLLSPAESCYNTIPFFYGPALSGLSAWFASGIPAERLGSALGFSAPFLLTEFCALALATACRAGLRLKTAVLSLLLLLPSYAIFRISYEIESDTPALACGAFFFYLLVRLARAGGMKDGARLWGFLGLAWALSWWIRIHLGLFFTFTVLAALAFSGQARKSFAALWAPGERVWTRPVRAGLFAIALTAGPFWQAVLWVHAGSPMAPKSVTPFGIRLAPLKPEFDRWRPPEPDSPPAADPAKHGERPGMLSLLRYDFLPLALPARFREIARNIRGILVGNTFSAGFTLLAALGMILAFRRAAREGLFTPEGLGLAYLGGMPLLFASHYYYYKILYAGVPVLVFFTGLGLESVARRFGDKAGGFLSAACAGMALVFSAAFLWTGVGTWPRERHGRLFATSLTSGAEKGELKNGDDMEPAIRYVRALDPREKLLYFHLEPGIGLAYALDRRPFWEEFHYDSQRLAALHRLPTREKVLGALSALGIRHIVLSYTLDRYEESPEPEVLPDMLRRGDPALERVAESSSGLYRIFRISTREGTNREKQS